MSSDTRGVERRLHPLSLLFSLGNRLGYLFVPALVAIFVARERIGPYVAMLVFGALGIVQAVLHYFTLRYRYDEHELVIRDGIVFRNERHIPYERIQNIDAVQTLVHRVLGVVTVMVQTGSGAAPEAKLSVLPMSALEEMRARVFTGARAARAHALEAEAGAPAAATVAPVSAIASRHTAPAPLVHLHPGELMLAGLIEGRGLVAVLAIVGFFAQLEHLQNGLTRVIEQRLPGVASLFGNTVASLSQNGISWGGIVLVVAGLVTVLLLLRLVSAVWTAIRLFDFRVTMLGEDLRVEHGLLTRVVNTIPLRRIQWVVVDETILHRLFGRVAVRLTTAGGRAREGKAAAEREWLAPILPRHALTALVEKVQPGLALDITLTRAHPRGFRRAMTVATVWAVALTCMAAFVAGWWSLLLLAVLELRAVIAATLLMRNLGWGVTPTSIVFRGGRLRRHTAGSRYSRLQTVTYEESPFDRRTGMATVRVDTAGAGGAHLEMRYLPQADAAGLRDLLNAKTAETAFVW